MQTLSIKPRAWKHKHWTLLIEVSRIQKLYMIIYVLLILSQFQLLSWKSAISMCPARHTLVTYCCVRDSLYTEQGASRGIGMNWPCILSLLYKRRADQATKSIPWADGMAPCKGSWHASYWHIPNSGESIAPSCYNLHLSWRECFVTKM